MDSERPSAKAMQAESQKGNKDPVKEFKCNANSRPLALLANSLYAQRNHPERSGSSKLLRSLPAPNAGSFPQAGSPSDGSAKSPARTADDCTHIVRRHAPALIAQGGDRTLCLDAPFISSQRNRS